jgi:dTMP kinase
MLIVIGGSDFSGKQTQTDLLCKNLEKAGFSVAKFDFPRYETPTGKIVGGPLLGKEHICSSFFSEGAGNVPAKVASLYYVADRLYNLQTINQLIKDNDVVILDRYSESNMAHQGGKLQTRQEREQMFDWLAQLEYGMCELPKPDIGITLYVPYETIEILRANRTEKADEVEQDKTYLVNSTAAYLEMAEKFGYSVIRCTQPDGSMRSIENIGSEIFDLVHSKMQSKKS